MRMVRVEEEMEHIRFAERAARYFALHPECQSFSYADIGPGCLLALRWGLSDDCVLVLKLDAHFEPTNYQNIISVKRGDAVRRFLHRMHVLKLTKGGHPCHPLYLKADLKPVPWS